jgi:hypothetical protein
MSDISYNLNNLIDGSVVESFNPPKLGSTPGFQNTFSQGAGSALGSNEFIGNTTMQDGYLQSGNYVPGVSGWYLDPTTGEFNFAVSVDTLDIPDTVTANSFHVDIDGDTWWGATTFGSAVASVSKAGAAIFKSIQVGGSSIQYTLNDSGIYSFGDGSDGAATMDGSATPTGTTKSGSDYTMTRDVYWTDATMSTGTTLNPAGYRIFGTGTLTLNGTAVIKRNGNDGSAGTLGGNGGAAAGTGGAGGAALADGYLKGSLAGGTGATGTVGDDAACAGCGGCTLNGVSAAGVATTNSIGSSGANGGTCGVGGDSPTGNGGCAASSTGGTATLSNVKLIANWHLATLLDIGSSGATVKFDNSGSSGGGAGGGGGAGTVTNLATGGSGGGGGGAGSGGGIIAVYFRVITIGASASITANGGNGGNGGGGGNAVANVVLNSAGGGGGGGGGAGGNGGQIILVYNSISNSGSITVAGGTGGTGGALGTKVNSGTDGTAGSSGSSGNSGTIRYFQLSL